MSDEPGVNVPLREDRSRARVIRPLHGLLRQGIITAIALTTPIFAALYWLTIPEGPWPIVLGVHVTIAAIAGLALIGYRGTSILVGPGGVHERGFFGGTHEVAVAQIGSILLIELYRNNALDTQPQLFVCDTRGDVIVRMRGMFWSRADMDTVVDQLDVPINILDNTMTLAELRRTRPGLLYWFERFPRLGA